MGLVLQNNGVDSLAADDNATFAFATQIASGEEYDVTVLSQPGGQTCAPESPSSGIVIDDNITVSVICVAAVLQWWSVDIPNIPSNSSIASIWTGARGDIYVLATRVGTTGAKMAESWLYRRTTAGTWSTVLTLPDSSGQFVYGTGPKDIFVGVLRCPNGTSGGWAACGIGYGANMYHASNGVDFTLQTIPSEVGTNSWGQPSGVANDVYVGYGTGVLRYNGSWSVVYTDCDDLGYGCGSPAYVGTNETYMVGCWGHYAYNGTTWTQYYGFDFCDVGYIWGVRDENGLHLYAAGNNNFSNCEHVWAFTENTSTPIVGDGSWGGKTTFAQSDCSTVNCGSATGLWGSGANDVWVSAYRGSSSCSGQTGRIYHYDGTAWSMDTTTGLTGTLQPGMISGTASDDVWVNVWDAAVTPATPKLLHYALTP